MPAYMPNDLQEDAIGAEIVLVALDQDGVPVDISGATLLEITIERPDESQIGPRTAVFDTDGTDGAFKILSEAGDLTPASPGWTAQGRYVVGITLDVMTSVFRFEVLANLS